MNHKKGFNRLGLRSAHRKALKNNLLTSLLKHEAIKTTKAKAKETKKLTEKLITRAINTPYIEYSELIIKEKNKEELTQEQAERLNVLKAQVSHNYRIVAKKIKDKEVLKKLFQDLAQRERKRSEAFNKSKALGGYTRIYHLNLRRGDGTQMVLLKLVSEPLKNE